MKDYFYNWEVKDYMIEAFKRIGYKFYSDFLLPNRLSEYRFLLELALDKGYKVHSVRSLWQILQNDGIESKFLDKLC